jgi:high-affinity iron transporter
MLINAVVMFLRELLPLLLLLSLLLFWRRGQWREFAVIFMLTSLIGLLLLTSQFSAISAWLDGQGLELVYAALYILTSVLLGWAMHCHQRLRRSLWLAAVSSACLSIIHGANLVLYLWLYQRSPAENQSLWLGAALGIGIGLSVAVLLYYFVQECQRYWRGALLLLLALVGARQVSMATAIFIQTDWLTPGAVLWDSQSIINEQSEYGYFLNALLGYEATPSVSLLLALVLSFMGLLLLGRRLEVKNARN